MKTALVTGGAGLIGSALCKRLLKDGYKIICVDNFITSNKSNISKLSKNHNFTLIKHDITKSLSSIFNLQSSIINHIYHLACPTGVPNLTTLSLEMLLTSSEGTKNILDLARKHNSSLVFTSSSEVYGDPLVFPQTEGYTGNVDSTGIRSPYEEGKRFAESIIISYVRKYNVNAKIVRVFNTYGKKTFDDTRVVSTFVKNALKNQPLPVSGKGSQTRTFCYVDDLVEALITVMEKGKMGEVYNAGSDKEIKIVDLAKTVISISNSKSKIKFTSRPAHDHARRLPDLKKLKKLGWKQKYTLEEGLKEYIGLNN